MGKIFSSYNFINVFLLFYFQGITVCECGIFFRDGIGASPDGLLSLKDFLLEIKTRSLNAECPLQNLEKYHFVQCQFQMHCSGRGNTIVMSYHPETHTASYFLFRYNSEFITVAISCLSSIYSVLPLENSQQWDSSCQKLKSLWEKNAGSIPDFKSLQPLRSWIGQLVKSIDPLPNVKSIFC